MLPVIHSDGLHTLGYPALHVDAVRPQCVAVCARRSALICLAAALTLGSVFVYWAVVLLLNRNPRAALATFRFSIVYLMALFVALMVDHYARVSLVAS